MSADLAYAAQPRQLRAGNRVTPLFGGGETFPAMLAAIRAAERTIALETYIVESDATGAEFADALIERARAGVQVRFIYDAVGAMDVSSEYWRRLRAGGVKLLEFHPIVPWKRHFNLRMRDHRKILVVDDLLGFTGGINIGDEYAPVETGGKGWYDVHVQLEGPAVLDLARAFRRVWIREGGDHYPAPPRPPRHAPHQPATGSLVRIVDNREVRKRWAIRRAYLKAINRARDHIYLMNAYFLPDRAVRRALSRAAKRGARVIVIIPTESDVRAVAYAGLYMYPKLLRGGVEILGWPDTMMHAKTAVIDALWSTIGSYNLDQRSLLYNLEVVAEIIDRDVGALMRDRFVVDAARCTALTLRELENLPWWRRALAWMFYQFRRWL